MGFELGQRVELKRDLQMSSGFTVPKGSQGTVSSVHFQTGVLFDKFEQSLQLADNDLKAAATQAQQTLGKVRLLKTLTFGAQQIAEGTVGLVTQAAPAINGSWVLFDGVPDEKLVPNIFLQKL